MFDTLGSTIAGPMPYTRPCALLVAPRHEFASLPCSITRAIASCQLTVSSSAPVAVKKGIRNSHRSGVRLMMSSDPRPIAMR
ncbi:hypothetical protein [Bradyrhizobium sp. AUGA SZCCT0182]|uniref:hypothetical protein n=1 Tax=Bradyrhizobium sp. AUGA SZCCT0182 TaxID=2807667 RepID=UPI001BA7D288|nr:hypothetical protein [Bradyrhizobium sp. AUGA SZCCT0182]MBR1235924.1 hypothetical protein [Bradyrhizobium sp. AUGA SZCCT0182]